MSEFESASVHGIVIAGTYPARHTALEALVPRPLLPVAQQPLITYALRWMSQGGLERATICPNSAARTIRSRVDAQALDMKLDYREDWNPRGAAGCVRDASMSCDATTFVVADGTSVPVVEIGDLVESHRGSESVLTVVVAADATGRLAPSGVYVFDRRAIEHIPAEGFQDIKERLIPRLYDAGEQVSTFVAPAAAPRVVNMDSYLALDHWAVARLGQSEALPRGFVRRGEAVVHESAMIDASARLLGPVLLGAGVRLAAGATLVGPLSIGAGSRIGAGAVVSRSVGWSGCTIGEKAVVDRCMLADGAVVPPGRSLFADIRTGDQARGARGRGSAWDTLAAVLRPAPADSL